MTVSTATPDSPAALAELVHDAARSGRRLTVNRDAAGDNACRIDLSRLNRVIDYPARDMTVTVEAGLTTEQLAAVLAEQGQQLPVDVSDPSCSVGSAVLNDLCGPRQLLHGTLRDYLLGFEAIDGRGQIFHAGGRVVKNVAGYDLCRLMVGSRGALGPLTKVTLKLKPLPPVTAVHCFRLHAESLGGLLERINETASDPLLLDVLTDASDTVEVRAGFAGLQSACDWQWNCFQQECRDLVPEFLDHRQATLADHTTDWASHTKGIAIRCLPSVLSPLLTRLRAAEIPTFTHAATALVYAGCEDHEMMANLVGELESHGQAKVQRHRTAVADSQLSSISVRLRRQFDPHGIFQT